MGGDKAREKVGGISSAITSAVQARGALRAELHRDFSKERRIVNAS
jgi:hypothetical protein